MGRRNIQVRSSSRSASGSIALALTVFMLAIQATPPKRRRPPGNRTEAGRDIHRGAQTVQPVLRYRTFLTVSALSSSFLTTLLRPLQGVVLFALLTSALPGTDRSPTPLDSAAPPSSLVSYILSIGGPKQVSVILLQPSIYARRVSVRHSLG